MHLNLEEGVSPHKEIHPSILRSCHYIWTIKLREDLMLKNFHVGWAIPINNRKRFLSKVVQTNLNGNSLKSSYIFLLDVNVDNLTVRLHVFIISSMLAKFQKYQKLIIISSNKYLNFKFLWYKIMRKKYVYWSNSK